MARVLDARLFLLGALAATAYPQATWTQRFPPASPPGLNGGALAYDNVRQRVVWFGGDTWEWNGSTWTERFPSASPASYQFGVEAMAFDSGRGRMVYFSGVDAGGFLTDATWEWDGSDWLRRTPPASPSARLGHAIAYDAARGTTVVFGGNDLAVGLTEDTWEWDGTSWTQALPANRPEARVDALMAYDSARQRIVLFGGVSNSTLCGEDTWEWDGTDWSLRATSGPGGRENTAIAYDASLGRVVLWGGGCGGPALGVETWAWDGTTWTMIATVGPPPRQYHALAYDSARRVSVLFGGIDESGNNATDTWELAGAPSRWTVASHAVGAGAQDVVAVDADSDGDQDLVTANTGSDDLSLLTNGGQGGFGVASSLVLGGGNAAPVAVAAADLDGDGAADDVAVACQDSHTVALVTGVSGIPSVQTLASAGLRPADVAAGDLNGNAGQDVVVARAGEPLAGGGGVEVVLDGGAAMTLPGSTASCVKVALGDLDGDGDLDIMAVARGGQDALLLWQGHGTGAFAFVGQLGLPTAGLANGLCCSDLDGDGDQDLAVALPVLFPPGSQSVQIWRYTGGGALDPGDFTAGAPVATAGTLATDLGCGDLEDDGIRGFQSRVDLAVVSAGSGSVATHHGFDGSAFASTATPSAGVNPIAVAIADLNGDGGQDLAIANQGGSVTVNLTIQPALAQSYGAGCPGTGGVTPAIAASGLPVAGTAALTVTVSSARSVAPALLAFATAPASMSLGNGCTLLLAPPLLTVLRFTDGAGQAALSFGVPSLPAVLGFDGCFQWLVFDPQGAFGPGVGALSQALRLQIGQ